MVADVTEPVTFSPYVWLFPLRGAATRFGLSPSLRPLWSPDGKSVAWEAVSTALFLKTYAGTENEALLLKATNLPDDGRLPCDWSDRRFIIYSEQDNATGYDLWKLPLAGDHKPIPLVRSQSNEYCGALSPDGRWIAYASDESGIVEIYVRPLPDEGLASGRPSQFSYDGGRWPKWSGEELFYLDREKYMVSVEVKTGAGFAAGTPRRLFPMGIHTPDARFDVTADNQRRSRHRQPHLL